MTVEWAEVIVALCGILIMLIGHAYWVGRKSGDVINRLKVLEATLLGKFLTSDREDRHCAEDRREMDLKINKLGGVVEKHGREITALRVATERR
jgi:hypothetical protein